MLGISIVKTGELKQLKALLKSKDEKISSLMFRIRELKNNNKQNESK